jgi:signal transduction histidine kinase
MTFYDIQTVYLVISLLYVMLPATAWMVLSSQRSTAAALWCSGGLVFSVSCFFFAIRGSGPDWLSYSAANYLLWIANVLLVMALRHQLQRPWRLGSVLVGLVIAILLFEYMNLVMEDRVLRFLWSLSILVGLFAYIHRLALCMAKTEGMRSATWLSAVYFIAACIISLRGFRVAFGFAPAGATVAGFDSMLTVLVGLLTSVLGNFAFVGTFLERISKQNLEAAALRARQEETQRLGGQIAHLDRQRALGAMSASFAHELSQPLTAILMDAENAKTALNSQQFNATELAQTLEDIQESSNHAVALIQRIRNFIKPSQTHHKSVDLQHLIRDVTDLMRVRARASDVQFRLEMDASPAMVWGDRIELSQIMVNVLRNAIEALQNSPTRWVTLQLTTTQDRCLLQFTDTGPGITTALPEPVGTPFVTSKPDGLGVGFSISRAIAEKHGGSLTIANAPSGGACVTLNLPRML